MFLGSSMSQFCDLECVHAFPTMLAPIGEMMEGEESDEVGKATNIGDMLNVNDLDYLPLCNLPF